MKSYSILALCLCIFVATACSDNTGPREVVQSAGGNLAKGNINGFIRLLSGDAATQYGDKNTALALREKLIGQKLVAGDPALKSGNDEGSTYIVPVINQTTGQVVLTAEANCDNETTPCMGNGIVLPGCTPQDVHFCSITEINLK